jgi:hypothetical protein
VKEQKTKEQRRKRTTKHVLQPLETSVEFTISRTLEAEFGFMLLVVKPSKSLQLIDLGIAALDIGT